MERNNAANVQQLLEEYFCWGKELPLKADDL